ncbi:hypothetical protein RVR_6954 [Actinacidiphila reveromycinica]|uniref:Resolvase/invertase-type recombinase catalytic domain-containing protein n=1 Tax=Actinacidiphila reveromycinica TaxID=659352 RepID=A0A7U3VQU7_9ACTN|nr:recombinase family protein [Streptomyces sp. SN-593]BBB00064.1 hypothetical protein RVR_6954 [Streptomyces sp. SN-593]
MTTRLAPEVPADSPCRTRAGKTAAKYHTARFVLVPALREELEAPVPEDRGPGRPWKPDPPVETMPAAAVAKPIRIGYARCSTAQQELRSQLDALEPACKRIFFEKTSTSGQDAARTGEGAQARLRHQGGRPDQKAILTVHALKRLARNAAELMTLSGELRAVDVQLERLTDPAQRHLRPQRHGRCAPP